MTHPATSTDPTAACMQFAATRAPIRSTALATRASKEILWAHPLALGVKISTSDPPRTADVIRTEPTQPAASTAHARQATP
eukprot:2507589-Rhodomonas_salina.1